MALSASVAINARNLLRALALALFIPVALAHASTFKVLYSFTGNDGCHPGGNAILDGAGNLYGTTAGGMCDYGYGTVFKIAPDGTETTLYGFPAGSGGAIPVGLVMDKKATLSGTTLQGGSGGGGIFKINLMDKEKVIHTFEGSPNDGCGGVGAMVIDTGGNFHGVTAGCGKYDYGAVFTLAPDGSESLLYSFKGGRDGFNPEAGLIIDSEGNLYGTTDWGGKVDACITGNGATGCGTIFKLAADGTKTELYKFKGPPGDGYIPAGNLIMDSSGNLYGTTLGGGRVGCVADYGCGVVFKLAPDGTETVLHFFKGGEIDGGSPAAGLIADSSGNLYGTTEIGGGKESCNFGPGCGTVFEIAADGTETILHKFKEATDGATSMAGLVADNAGNLYGTAYFGGAYGYGTVFKITP